MYQGHVYRKLERAKFTYIFCGKVKTSLHAILANMEVANVIAPVWGSLNQLLTDPACQLIRQIIILSRFYLAVVALTSRRNDLNLIRLILKVLQGHLFYTTEQKTTFHVQSISLKVLKIVYLIEANVCGFTRSITRFSCAESFL